LINYDRIIAEITTPIRCAIAGDTVKVLMPVEEWQKQRGIEKLRPIKDEKQYYTLFKDEYHLTELEKQIAPQVMQINNQLYELDLINPDTKIARYSRERNFFNIFITDYWIYYDLELQKAILSSEDVMGKYWTLMGPGSKRIHCNGPTSYINLYKLRDLSYLYNF
ncbi:hypothetical protein ACFFHT_01745, partial [Gallibacterium melopsittaci]